MEEIDPRHLLIKIAEILERSVRRLMGKDKIVIILVAFAALVAGGYGAYLKYYPITPMPKGVVCTQEAKQCPDGSYVSRTGPKCEFTACPVNNQSEIDTSTWKTYRNEEYGFEMRYAENWSFKSVMSDVTKKEVFELTKDDDKISIFPGGFYEGSDIDFSKLETYAVRVSGLTATREDYNDSENGTYWTAITFEAPKKIAIHFSHKQKSSEVFESFLKNLKIF